MATDKKYRRRVTVDIPDRLDMLMDGRLTVDDLDDEEITRGQLRNVHGDFRGRPPGMIPRAFLDAVRIKRQQIWNEQMEGMVVVANQTLLEVMEARSAGVFGVNDTARMNAAKFVIERAQGKTPENVNVKAEVKTTWEQGMEDVMVEIVYDEDMKEIEQ